MIEKGSNYWWLRNKNTRWQHEIFLRLILPNTTVYYRILHYAILCDDILQKNFDNERILPRSKAKPSSLINENCELHYKKIIFWSNLNVKMQVQNYKVS